MFKTDAMGATALFQGIRLMSPEDREVLRVCTLRIVQVPKCLDPLNDLVFCVENWVLSVSVLCTYFDVCLVFRIECLSH